MHCSEADNNGKAVVNGNKEGMVSLDSLNTNQDLVATDDTDHTFHRHKLKSSLRHQNPYLSPWYSPATQLLSTTWLFSAISQNAGGTLLSPVYHRSKFCALEKGENTMPLSSDSVL